MLKGTVYYKLVLLSAVACAAHDTCEEPRRRNAFFKLRHKDRMLIDHVILSRDVTSPTHCSMECLSNHRCASFNLKKQVEPPHVCELNNQTAAATPNSLVKKNGSDYYDKGDNDVPTVCASSPCANGGTCSESCDLVGYRCACPPGFGGKACQIWEGVNGSSAQSPGRSCLQLKEKGFARGDGKYWIRPTLSVQPFSVFCDMTIDEGGWTQLKKIVYHSSLSSYLSTTSDYTGITDTAPINLHVNTDGILQLQKDMGFDQIRFYCHKQANNKTFHIMTNKDDNGRKAVRCLIETVDPRPAACGSFTRLHDDNSILSRNCAKWGDTCDGTNNCDFWGHTSYTLNMRLYLRAPWYVDPPPHGIVRTFGCQTGTLALWCDDHTNVNLIPGDKFAIYVR
ncbi:uncharacterized protein LOC116613155 isoform X2 [Nematostella vectensis]|nr:uncharacterized protein LOC116613155 isoform X2 [Nematostella vectensis]